LLFILVSCGSLGFVVANLLTDELTEKIKRLEAQNQDKDAIIEGMTIERNIENLAFQAEILRLKQFKIAGDWTPWGDWSGCSSSCGGGVRERRRQCNNPSASCGGPECVGDETETASCPCGGQAIFISGGYGGSKTEGYGITSTEVLDLENSTFSRTTADLLDSRQYHSSHFLNNSLVICGGTGTTEYPLLPTEKYYSCIVSSSPTTGDWRNHSTTIGERERHSGTVIDNKIYLVASSYGLWSAGQSTEYWDGERWQEGPKLQYGALSWGSCTVTTSPTTILVTGGEGHPFTSIRKNAVELNIITGRWRNLPDMTEERFGHSCTVVGRKVVVAGPGRTSAILDLDTEEWSTAGDMTTERMDAQMVTVNGHVIMLGGFADGHKLDTVEELDMEQRTWRRLGVRMKTPRYGFGATVMDKRDLGN